MRFLKADVLDLTEGSSPLHEMASVGVTTGVVVGSSVRN
jgi:hypothetical protein